MSTDFRRNSRRLCRIFCKIRTKKNTAVALGVLVDRNGVKSAGGYIITPMPDATEEEISKIEQSIFKAGAISKMLDKNMTLLEIAKAVTGDENVQLIEENITPVYECDCSKEHMEDGLATLDKDVLKEMIEEDGKAELVCHFCNKKYEFSKEELEDILEKKIKIIKVFACFLDINVV